VTDARFPDRWLSDKRIQRLSDAHFRAFIHALAWSATNGSDGVIEPEDLELIPRFPKDAVRAFLAANLWEPRGGEGRGWLMVDFIATQTTALQMKAAERARAADREKKARQRAAGKAGVGTGATGSTSTAAVVPEDVPPDVPGDNTGKARQGKDRQGPEGDQLPLAAGAENLRAAPVWHGPGANPYDEYK
jgi:hypothetical protein